MKKIGFQCCMLLSALFTARTANAQCVLDVTPSSVTVLCGTSLDISAIGLSTPVLSTNFDDAEIGPGWSSSATLLYTNPCGPSLDGTPSAWFGNVPLPRTLTTNGFDVSCGGQVCFDLDFAGDDHCLGCNDCDDPDDPEEGVYFQYSIDGGTTWVDIFYFEPTANTTGPYYDWANYCFTIPSAAWTVNTMFQWHQEAVTSTIYDHWGIDNVTITPSLCDYWYDWDNIPGSPDNPEQTVSPISTTQYAVEYTNGVDSCFDTVMVIVNPLLVSAATGLDTIICGNCSDLLAELTNIHVGSVVDDFNPSQDPLMWDTIQSATVGTGCTSITGNALHFNGTGVERSATSVALDATQCSTIDFCLFMGNTGSSAPCENADNGENVVLEYSTDGGVTWMNIATYDQSLWDNNNDWQCFSEIIPVDARILGSMFRWRQVTYTFCTNCDSWSLDDVQIACTPTNYTYAWTPADHLNDPALKAPQMCPPSVDSTFTYHVTITNTLMGCTATDSVSFFVEACSCNVMQFTATAQCQPDGTFDIAGEYEYAIHPGTGTVEISATNNSGTITETVNGPFTDSTVFNYILSGLTNDGSQTTVTIYFSASPGCTATVLADVPVSPTVVSVSGGDSYCIGDIPAPVVVEVTGTSGWTIDYTLDGVPMNAGDVVSTVSLGNAAGVYEVTRVTDANCVSEVSFFDMIVINDLPAVDAGLDVDLCEGDEVTLNGSGADVYNWNNGIVNGIGFTPSTTLVYTVTGVALNGCQNTDSLIVSVHPYPSEPDVAVDGQTYCAGDQIPFVASGTGDYYTWYSDVTLGNALVQSQTFTPTSAMGYTAYFVTQTVNECESAPVAIGVFIENCEVKIVIPNVITIDGDQINDLMVPITLIGITSMNTVILNRWGNLIYQTDDLQINWDGKTMRGDDVSEGTYFWTIIYTDLKGEEHQINGNIQVIR